MRVIRFKDKLSLSLQEVFNSLEFSSTSNLERKIKVLVAFSGGKDSLSLLDYLNQSREIFNIELIAIHINHQLRTDSINDEKFCIDFCIENDIYLVVETINIDTKLIKNRGIEAAARKVRYEYIYKTAKERAVDYIFTAHTLDDQLESFFIDLMTGTSIYTLGGISRRLDILVRPMLDISTADINEYLDSRSLKPIYDSSNDDKRFIRNSVRDTVNSLMRSNRGIANSILLIQDQSRALNASIYNRCKIAIVEELDTEVSLDRDIFTRFDYEDQIFLLGKIFSKLFRFGRSNIVEALKILDKNGSRRIQLPENYIFESSYNMIYIYHSAIIEDLDIVKEVGVNSVIYKDKIVNFKGDLINSKLYITKRYRGDKIRGKKMKDILIDKKITLKNRDRLIVVRDSKTIYFVEQVLENKLIDIRERILI